VKKNDLFFFKIKKQLNVIPVRYTMDFTRMRTIPIDAPMIGDVFEQYQIHKITPLELPPLSPALEMESISLLTGIGTLLCPTFFYEGEFVDGVIHGKGKCVYKTIQYFLHLPYNEYEGDFVKGEKHGRGTLRFVDGTTIENIRFVRDVFQGELSWEDPHTNIRYRAQAHVDFVLENKHPIFLGHCIMTDGTTYEGIFIVSRNIISFASQTQAPDGYRQYDIKMNKETMQFV